jgi:pyruvate/2-oxoglutarate dehydrogenase complex dihydrolipoamide acyltransferase (E2) component
VRIPITMAQTGFDADTARVAAWLKAVGQPVVKGEAVAEIETEKATVELEALDAGTLVEIVEPAGSEVAVGAVLAWLDDGR